MREMVRKMKHIRVIAAIVMCMVAGSVEASEVTVFEEYFNLSTSVNSTITEYNGWTLSDCFKKSAEQIFEVRGYAISKIIGDFDGKVKIAFECATEKASYVNDGFIVSLLSGSSEINSEKITVESNSIYLKSGIYAVSCNIALNINGTPDDTVYHFYLKIDNVIVSYPFSYKTGHTAHESLYNLSSIIRVGGDKKLELSLYCDEDPKITGSEDFVIVKNQILQYLAISEL